MLLPPCVQRKSLFVIDPGSENVLNLLIHSLDTKNCIKLGWKKAKHFLMLVMFLFALQTDKWCQENKKKAKSNIFILL